MKKFEEQLKQRNQKISTIGRTKGSKTEINEQFFFTSGLVCSIKSTKKRDGLIQHMSRGRDQ